MGLAPGTQVMLTEGKGCRNCNQTGYRDRIAIHEILQVDRTIRRMINDKKSVDDVQAYAVANQGMKTLADAAAAAVVAGKTTLEEYLKIVYQV